MLQSKKMAGLNWLEMSGWELETHPTAYRSEMKQEARYRFRMDVSELSTDQINGKLSALRPDKTR